MNSHRQALIALVRPRAGALAARALPVLLALLLLALPAACVIHCLAAMGTAHHAAHSAGDGAAHFFCELPMPPAARDLFIPAYLPAIAPRLAAFVATILLVRVLTLLPPAPLRPLLLAPPTPPPRVAG
jgi:hypothetical protein